MFEARDGNHVRRWDLVRVRTGCETKLVLASQRFFSLTAHWVGVSVPCAGDDCALCETHGARGLFYLAGFCQGRIALLELAAQSAGHLEQHLKLLHNGFVPGLEIRFCRKGSKTPLWSEVVGMKENVQAVSHLELVRHVMALYKFPTSNPDESLESYEQRLAQMARVRNRVTRQRLEKQQLAGMSGPN